MAQARLPARFDGSGEAVLLDVQDCSLWEPKLINEGLALMEKGPGQVTLS